MTSLIFLLDSAAINGQAPPIFASRAVGRSVRVSFYNSPGAVDTGGDLSGHRGFGPFPPTVVGAGVAFHGPGVRLADSWHTKRKDLRERPQSLRGVRQFSSRTNLLKNNPGFSIAALGSSWGASTANAVITFNAVNAAPPSPPISAQIANGVDAGGLFTETLQLNPGATYTYSVWLENNGGSNTAVTLTVRDATGFSAVAFTNVTITSKWTRYTLTFQAHPTIPGHLFYVEGTSGTNFIYLVDALQVEAGSVATDFIDSPFLNPSGPTTVDNAQQPVAGYNKALGPRLPLQQNPGAVYGGPRLKLTPIESGSRQRRRTLTDLRPPTVVKPQPNIPPIRVVLADIQDRPYHNSRQRRPWSGLRSPAVIYAPPPAPPLEVRLAPSIRLGRRPSYELRPPAVAAQPSTPFIASPIKVNLVEQPRRITRMRPDSRLTPPKVVLPSVTFGGPRVKLVIPRSPGDLLPRKASSRLEPPASVGAGIAFRGPRVKRAKLSGFNRARPVDYRLFPPTVIAATPFFASPIKVNLVEQPRRITRMRPDSRLFPPAVTAPFFAHPIQVTLTRIRPRPTDASVFGPVVIAAAEGPQGGIGVQLVQPPQKAFSTRSELRAPAVVTPAATAVFFGPKVTLADQLIRITRKRPKSRLLPVPAAFQPFPGVKPHLAASFRGEAKSHLSAPVVVGPVLAPPLNTSLARIKPPHTIWRLAPPSVVAPVLARPIVTHLARITPPHVISILRRPTDLIDAQDLGAVRVHLAYSSRGTPKSRLSEPTVVGPVLATPIHTPFARIRPTHTIWLLRAPTVIAPVLARPIDEELINLVAQSERPKTRSRLSPPTVVAPVLAPPIHVTLVRIKPVHTITRLAAPTAVAPVLARALLVHLAPSSHGVPKSRIFPPTVVAAFIALPVQTNLAYSLRGIPKSRLFAPTVVAPVLARAILVHLAPSSRGEAKSHLSQPAIVGPVLARPIDEELVILLAKSERPRTISRLAPPVVVGPVLARTILVHLAPSARGQAKSRLFAPVVVAPVLARPIDEEIIVLVAQSERPKTRSRLNPPIVVAPVLARPILTHLVRITPPHVISVLRRPIDLVDRDDLGYVRIHLAPSFRGELKSHLSAPTVVAPVLARAILVHLAPSSHGAPKSRINPPTIVASFVAPPLHVASLARIRPVAVHSILRRPTDLVDAQDLGYLRAHLAYSLRGAPKSHLSQPTVVAPVLARAIIVHLAPSERGTPKSKLFAPAVVGAILARPLDEELTVILAKSERPFTRSRLAPPTVVAPVLARSVVVHLAPSFRGEPKSRLFAPTVVAPVLASHIDEELIVLVAQAIRPKTLSRLFPPAAVAPVLARPILTHLVRITPPHVISVLRRPIDLVDRDDLGYVRIHLAPSFRGEPKSRLSAPTVVAPVLARAILVHLAPSSHGAPKSRINPPTIVASFVAPPLHVASLARIRPVAVRSILRRPTDLVDAQDLGYLRAHLTYSLRGAPKSHLFPPTVIAPVLARAIIVHLAPSLRGEPKSKLFEPAVVGPILARPLDEELTVILAKSERPSTRSRLTPPVVVAPVLARAILVHLAPGSRGAAKSKLVPPAVVSPILARPLDEELIVLANQAYRPKTRSRLAPPVVVAPILARAILVHLAPSSRGVAKSRLQEPTVVQAFIARPVSTKTVRISPAPARYILRKPTDLVDQQDLGQVQISLAYSLRGAPRSRLAEPAVVAPVLARAIVVHLAPSFRGEAKSRLAAPSVVAPVLAAHIDEELVNLADASYRPKTRSRLAPPAVVGPVLARAILTHLAPSFRGAPKSHLEPPVVVSPVLAAHIDEEIIVLVQQAYRPKTRSRLTPPLVISPVLARPIDVRLAPSFRGEPKSRLFPPTAVAPVLARAIITHLAYSLRGEPKSELRPPIPPETFPPVREELAVQLTRVVGERKTMARLQPPTVVFPFFARRTEITLVRIVPPAVHSALRKPLDTVGLEDQGSVSISLSYSLRGKPKSHLSAPAVVAPVLARAIATRLTRITPPPVRSILREPTVIDTRPQVYYLATTLAPSFRGEPKSILRPDSKFAPQPQADYVLLVHLAYSSRGIPKSKLRAPAVVGAGIYFRGILVQLAPSSFGKPKSRLLPVPAAFQPVGVLSATLAPSRRPVVKSRLLPVPAAFRPVGQIAVTLAPSFRGVPKSELRAPTVVGPILARPIDEELIVLVAQSVRPKVRSRLQPPTVVAAFTARALSVHLTYALRGKPKSRLLPPAVLGKVVYALEAHLTYSVRGTAKSRLARVIYAAKTYPPIRVTLAPSTRIDRTPHSRLSEPTVVAPFIARPLRVELAVSSRGTAKSFLRPPALLPELARALQIALAPSTRPETQHFLRLPIVTEAARPEIRDEVTVALAEARRPRTISRLQPPTVLEQPITHEPVIHLVRIRPTRTTWMLRKPAVVRQSARADSITVTLVRIAPAATRYLLRKPTVIGEPAAVYFGPKTTLVRIRPPRTMWALSPVAAFRVCYGIVCGFDSAPQVSGSDTGPEVTGSDTSTMAVGGSDSAAKVTGATAPGGNVSGSDERREGC